MRQCETLSDGIDDASGGYVSECCYNGVMREDYESEGTDIEASEA